MSEYKGTKGFTIQNYTTDPDNPLEGQVWYNETTGALKVESVTTTGSWATGGNLGTGRYHLAGAGTQTAALAFGGLVPPVTGATELYDGSSWTTSPATLSTARRSLSGLGTQTAALGIGGTPLQAITESWNGTSWTEVNDLNTAREVAGVSGIQTAALIFGGLQPGPANSSATESWNGTSWTTLPATLNNARRDGAAFGTQTSAIFTGGVFQPIGYTESYNGTAWTEVNDLNTARGSLAGAGTDNTSGVVFGGYTPAGNEQSVTESWDGTSWTNESPMSVSRRYLGGAGSKSFGLSFGGIHLPASPTATEEWTGAGAPVAKTITTTG